MSRVMKTSAVIVVVASFCFLSDTVRAASPYCINQIDRTTYDSGFQSTDFQSRTDVDIDGSALKLKTDDRELSDDNRVVIRSRQALKVFFLSETRDRSHTFGWFLWNNPEVQKFLLSNGWNYTLTDCATAADCNLGTTLYDTDNYRCTGNLCEWTGCNSTSECVDAMMDSSYVCGTLAGLSFSTCVKDCNTAADCYMGSSLYDADNYQCVSGLCHWISNRWRTPLWPVRGPVCRESRPWSCLPCLNCRIVAPSSYNPSGMGGSERFRPCGRSWSDSSRRCHLGGFVSRSSIPWGWARASPASCTLATTRTRWWADASGQRRRRSSSNWKT